MTSAFNTNTCNNYNYNYDKYLEYCENVQIPVISVSLNDGKKLAFLIEMDPEIIGSFEKKYNFTNDILKEWNCNVCKNRFNKLKTFVDANGNPIFCNQEHNLRSELQKNISLKCKDLINKYNTLDFKWNFKIVTNDLLYTSTPFEGVEQITGRLYRHYSYKPEFISDKLNNNDEKLLVKALHKYSPLLNNLLKKIGLIKNMIDSCNELKVLLTNSVYGCNQLPAINWFINLLNEVSKLSNLWENIDFSKKLEIIAKTICNSPYCEGDSDSAHIGYFHTVNGFILDILENGYTPTAVVKMIEERNNPTLYRRKIAPPSEGNIQAAEKLCENLVNTIETIEQLESHEGCVAIKDYDTNKNSNEMTNAFAAMRKENDKNKYGSFANRMRHSISNANNLKEIINDIKCGIINKVEIEKTNLSTVYTAHTTLNENDLSYKVGHLWAFMGSTYRFKELETVSHIYHFKVGKFNNIMFIIKNSRETLKNNPINNNCMFPEFLAPKHRSCEKAVEKLNSLTKIAIPESGEISLGMGSSAGFENGKLVNHIKLVITSNNGLHKHTVKIYNI
tara:strand:- start:215 stop:1900 length:1686 start_codon:yes stop_codon:yes gene_type:complete